MPDVSFTHVNGVDAKDSIERSWFSTLDVTETLIDSDADEVDPLTSRNEELVSPLKGREEHSNSIPNDSKESINFLEGGMRK